MNTTVNKTSKTTLIKHLILLFFIIIIPVTLIAIFLISPYQQSITVSFDGTKIKKSQYTKVEKLPGFSLVLDQYVFTDYTYEDDDSETARPLRNYTGQIKLNKNEDNPISYTTAEVKIILKAKFEANDITLATKTISSVKLDSTSTSTNFSIDYYNKLPYTKFFKTYRHPIMYIQIKFTKETSSSIIGSDTKEYEYYYVKLDPALNNIYLPS